MGVKWGIEATAENLLFMKSKLPAGAVWSVLGVGRAQLPMITLAMILGGHVRVGFEDNIYLKRGSWLRATLSLWRRRWTWRNASVDGWSHRRKLAACLGSES